MSIDGRDGASFGRVEVRPGRGRIYTKICTIDELRGCIAALPNTALPWVRMCGNKKLPLTREEPLRRGLLRPPGVRVTAIARRFGWPAPVV